MPNSLDVGVGKFLNQSKLNITTETGRRNQREPSTNQQTPYFLNCELSLKQ